MAHFGGIEEEFSNYENAKIAVVPVPYDGTSTWIKGADKGPEALLHASENMELYDIETDSEVYIHGIHTCEPVTQNESPRKMMMSVFAKVHELINDDKFVVLLGGEHSVSIGSIIAHAEKYQDLSVLQLDAHTDLRNEYEGSIYNHACVMARAKELCHFTQVGIRSMDVEEKANITHPDQIMYAHQIRELPEAQWIDKVVSGLKPDVYITIDLDVFDPSIMPSTGTPEPGGLLWYEVQNLLKKVNERCNIVGFDVVELCPNKENKAPDFLAAKLVYRLLSEKFNA